MSVFLEVTFLSTGSSCVAIANLNSLKVNHLMYNNIVLMWPEKVDLIWFLLIYLPDARLENKLSLKDSMLTQVDQNKKNTKASKKKETFIFQGKSSDKQVHSISRQSFSMTNSESTSPNYWTRTKRTAFFSVIRAKVLTISVQENTDQIKYTLSIDMLV